ncbi:cbb3-type cytochrome c oxidase subunit II [Gracilimonas sp.]|uniref:cbb3-type cytochrome c oxidase subunit II n=1 Tax=Gracilimonas sp. TaxID=1974203 RepID=UPI0028715FCA|nr:cbb3-type cytochrome c oxidase subunit II [Gracilimonas sp.]
MGNNILLIFGAVALFISSMLGLVYIPQMLADKEVNQVEYVAPNIENGHKIYVREGCVYCHTQQVRPKGFGADFERGWGEASLPEDYKGLTPHVLGTMRTGPDLANIGKRQPSRDWHYTHLYAPESVSPGSIMPPFPWLFEVVDEDEATSRKPINLPGEYAKEGKKVIPTEEAEHLVDYLLSLDQEREKE